MAYKIDYLDGDVVRWSVTDSGVTQSRDTSFTPTLYVSGRGFDALDGIAGFIADHPNVAETGFTEARTVWRNDPETVLEVAVDSIEAVTDVGHEIRGWGEPGEYKLYNVDFSREFRYCLEREIDPTPTAPLTTCSLSLAPKQLNDGVISPLEIDDESVEGSTRRVLETVRDHLLSTDPDVLIVSAARLVELLYELADRLEVEDFALGRAPGYQQLARESTFQSYGRVGHSPARYNLPGRVLIDRENTFFLNQSNLAGLLDLTERSAKPLQETAWSSIGNVLTAIQIREARRRGVLVPWNSWRHEYFKSMRTLHEADRGGFIFSPKVGLHDDVHELDFASLYPNIIVTRNVSPDKIRCACHDGREDVPGLGYSICDERGFLPDVLEPIITDRARYKTEIKETDDEDRRRALQGRSDALKWILVACFGYQGFSNAKFGRIECHEAINAFAREIILDTKDLLERGGWEVIHGIVDSVWVRPMPERDQRDLNELAREITEEIGITLEYEAHYDWIAFVPRRQEAGGALNRYFAKIAGEDAFKKRGIELRQRSTPPFIKECQREYLHVLDETRSAEAVCDRLMIHLARLRRGGVDATDLLVKQRVSKPLDEYTQATRGVAALERASGHDFAVNPGESVRYVVVDDQKSGRERVRLEFEPLDRYDAEFYADLLVRATESIVSPIGWDRQKIRKYLSDTQNAHLSAFS